MNEFESILPENKQDSDVEILRLFRWNPVRLPNWMPMLSLIAVGVLLFAGPVSGQTETKHDQKTVSADLNSIESILLKQVKAWNDGDLEKFMDTYWKSDKLTFSSGGKTTYGWKATLDNYKKSYAPPKEMGHLHFDGLEISMIESNSALVLGRWHLKMKDVTKRDGNFSLVVKKMGSSWKIIHDHSSSLDTENKAEKENENK